MNRILTSSILALGLLSSAALADIAVYEGKTVVKGTSGVASATVPVRTIQVVDTVTGESQAIHSIKFGKFLRKFAVAPKVAPVGDESLITSVTDKKKKKVNTVISYANVTTSDDGTQVTGSLLLRGQNAKVTIKGTDKVDLPKLLQGNTSLVVKVAAGQPSEGNALVLATSVLKLDATASKAANDAAPALTLDEVVEQIRQDFAEDDYDEEDSLTSFPGF